MRNVLSCIVMLSAALHGCGDPFGVYSPSRIHRTVQSLGGGLYVVDYEWPYVEDVFGRDRFVAVPEYLKSKGLVPPECGQGVVVVRGGKGEGGKGWAEFRCK